MHVMDHRGVISIAAGSLLYKLITSCDGLGRNQAARMSRINALMKQHQKDHGTTHRMPALRKEDLRKDGWSCLTGKVVKAANTRCMLPFLLELAEDYFDGTDSYDVSIRKVFTSLVEIQKVLYSSGCFLADTDVDKLDALFRRVGRHWQNLRHLSSLRKENNFHISPKVHYMLHLPAQARLINPIFTQCYTEESMVGRVCKIWHSCANGPYQSTIQRTALLKYWVGFELRVTE